MDGPRHFIRFPRRSSFVPAEGVSQFICCLMFASNFGHMNCQIDLTCPNLFPDFKDVVQKNADIVLRCLIKERFKRGLFIYHLR